MCYVCMYACMHVCMYVLCVQNLCELCMRYNVCACVYAYTCMSVPVSMYVCINTYAYL